ncbi:MAG TPA: hypothetical protein VL119_11475 [Acidimicrobiia bacterium]|nr:hypothetical protein [Acidimicrobiia bacterium]
MAPARVFVVSLLAIAALLTACGSDGGSSSGPAASGDTTPVTAAPPEPSTYAPWPAPSDPLVSARAAGLVPETAERLEFHVHSHLDVYLNGRKVLVPAGIGIDTTNPGVHQFTTDGLPAWGGIVVPCDKPCISPLHTHDVTGILHTESATRKYNTLGQFFVEWNVPLTTTCVDTYCEPATPIAVYVDGTKFGGDPRTIALSNLKEIAVVIGTPPVQIPNTADWNQI